jgi:hypothetical protein
MVNNNLISPGTGFQTMLVIEDYLATVLNGTEGAQ